MIGSVIEITATQQTAAGTNKNIISITLVKGRCPVEYWIPAFAGTTKPKVKGVVMRVFILRLVIFFGLLFPALASADTPISDARVFAFAEANYPSLFSGTVTDGQYQQYDYRYYLNNRNYLAIDTTGMIYIMGSATGGVISPVGTVASFANTIIAWEATQTSSLQWNLGYWDTQKWN